MLDWHALDTVLLDMDGTLLDLHFDNYFWHEYLPDKWGENRGLDPLTARRQLLPRLQSREGTLLWYCLDHWSVELQVDIMSLKANLEHLICLRPEAAEFLDGLRRLHKQIILVTNSHEALLEMKLARTRIGDAFDAIVCSHRLGLPKEDSRFWELLQRRHPFDPGRTLLIDDNLDVLRSAADFGIRQLLTIEQPDSQKPPRSPKEFPAVQSFLRLLVVDGTGA